MARYAVYVEATGEIVKTGTCQPSDISSQAKTGQVSISCPAEISDSTHRFDVDIGAFVEVPTISKSSVSPADEVRYARSELLNRCDWTQIPDADLSESEKEAWRLYRQELRDLPQVYADIESVDEVVWPEQPE